MFAFFKSTPPVNDKSFLINITPKGVIINGKKKFSLPCDMKKLTKIFGSPRAAMFETDRENKEFLEAMHGQNTVTNRVNFSWDSLGVYCYTLNGKKATCFGIRITDQPIAIYPQTPKTPFRGTVTVNGSPWLEAVKRGEDCEVFFNLINGEYSVIAEYTDDETDPWKRGEQDFTEIEVQKG